MIDEDRQRDLKIDAICPSRAQGGLQKQGRVDGLFEKQKFVEADPTRAFMIRKSDESRHDRGKDVYEAEDQRFDHIVDSEEQQQQLLSP